ncbi:hypothetical protein AWB68_07088 [Caballeronia choica]|jgi:hypothetical protein|uniref:Uncharacterized protein n=1 Tax=Caballeronia choica TaxID=326476 RepID=A0A158KRV2_9BURK|nr:hypothetical protein AWB68_07088 [Caballeronia choica]
MQFPGTGRPLIPAPVRHRPAPEPKVLPGIDALGNRYVDRVWLEREMALRIDDPSLEWAR